MNDEEKTKEILDLYENLVNQIRHYNGVIWQVPTALVVANAVAVNGFLSNQLVLIALVVFNGAMIYAFYKMIFRQEAIIEATKAIERRLEKVYAECIPRP